MSQQAPPLPTDVYTALKAKAPSHVTLSRVTSSIDVDLPSITTTPITLVTVYANWCGYSQKLAAKDGLVSFWNEAKDLSSQVTWLFYQDRTRELKNIWDWTKAAVDQTLDSDTPLDVVAWANTVQKWLNTEQKEVQTHIREWVAANRPSWSAIEKHKAVIEEVLHPGKNWLGKQPRFSLNTGFPSFYVWHKETKQFLGKLGNIVQEDVRLKQWTDHLTNYFMKGQVPPLPPPSAQAPQGQGNQITQAMMQAIQGLTTSMSLSLKEQKGFQDEVKEWRNEGEKRDVEIQEFQKTAAELQAKLLIESQRELTERIENMSKEWKEQQLQPANNPPNEEQYMSLQESVVALQTWVFVILAVVVLLLLSFIWTRWR